MSYTRTITSNGNSISQEGGQSFNQQLDDLQEQIEEGGGGSITDLGTSSGTANALAGASLVDTATTFTAGRLYRIRTNAANSGAATCSINGGTGVAMKKSPSSAALASGDIADATELLLYYDGTNLQVLSGMTVSADDTRPLDTLQTPATSGGTGSAFTLTDARLGTLSSGQVFAFVASANNGAGATLAVNGGSALNLKYPDNTGWVNLSAAGQFLSGSTVIVEYVSGSPGHFKILSALFLVKEQIPGTLNSTTFAGKIISTTGIDTGGSRTSAFVASGRDYTDYTYGALSKWCGDQYSGTPGCALHFVAANAGAAHKFYSNNGTEQLRVDENGLTLPGTGVIIGNTSSAVINLNTSNGATLGYSSGLTFVSDSTGAHVGASTTAFLDLRNAGATNGGGTAKLSCKMLARAASTTYSKLFPCAAGDHGDLKIIDTTMTGDVVTVVSVKAGAIVGIAGDTSCYVTGSPTGDQCQLTVASNFIVATTGNGYTRTMGVNGAGMGTT